MKISFHNLGGDPKGGDASARSKETKSGSPRSVDPSEAVILAFTHGAMSGADAAESERVAREQRAQSGVPEVVVYNGGRFPTDKTPGTSAKESATIEALSKIGMKPGNFVRMRKGEQGFVAGIDPSGKPFWVPEDSFSEWADRSFSTADKYNSPIPGLDRFSQVESVGLIDLEDPKIASLLGAKSAASRAIRDKEDDMNAY